MTYVTLDFQYDKKFQVGSVHFLQFLGLLRCNPGADLPAAKSTYTREKLSPR